jgi:hypothetical protein
LGQTHFIGLLIAVYKKFLRKIFHSFDVIHLNNMIVFRQRIRYFGSRIMMYRNSFVLRQEISFAGLVDWFNDVFIKPLVFDGF